MRLLLSFLLLLATLSLSAQKYVDQAQDTIYKDVDQPPSFPNGDQEMYDFIEEQIFINAPTFKQNRLAREGYYTLLRFVVDKNGNIHDVAADNRSEDYYMLDELKAAFREMPTWEPGKVDGEPVNTLVYLELNMMVENGDLEIRYHPLFPDSVTWTRKKMTKKQKTWAALAAVALTGIFVLIFTDSL